MNAVNGDYRLLITGERDWCDRNPVEAVLSEAVRRASTLGMRLVIVHGACKSGADLFVKELCEEMGIAQDPHPAQWRSRDSGVDLSAGPRRNAEMVATNPRRFVAFWSGKIAKSGTNGCMALCAAAGISGAVVARKAKP